MLSQRFGRIASSAITKKSQTKDNQLLCRIALSGNSGNTAERGVQSSSAETKPSPSGSGDERPSELKGRDLLGFDSYSTNEILTTLWTALDLKVTKNDAKEAARLCDGKSAFCIFEDPITKLTMLNATRRLGAVATCLHDSDINPLLDLEFFGRSLSAATDIIFIEAPRWKLEDFEKIAKGSIVPVINLRSIDSSTGVALAECLSLQEYYGFLRRLTVSYIGPDNNPLLNTYATLFPKLGMHFRYVCDGKLPEETLERGLSLAKEYKTEFHQCDNMADAIFRSNTISTCFHNLSELYLTVKDIKEADLDWTLFHHDVYKSPTRIAPELIHSKQSLVWAAISNLEWIIKAIMVANTTDFTPSIIRPRFQGEE